MNTITRSDVVQSHVRAAWFRTVEIAIELEKAGYSWSTQTVLATLHALYDAGRIERRQIGRAYEWRTVPAPAAEPRDALRQLDADAILAELRDVIERSQRPAPAAPITVPELDARLAEHPLDNLFDLDNTLAGRIVKRAQYDALRKLLDVLDGWIEGARENNEAMQRHDDPQIFHAEDIRRMVNDAAREVGTREPYRKDDADA